MTLSYFDMENDGARYPAPKVPPLPVAGIQGASRRDVLKTVSRFSGNDSILVQNGRSALFSALRHAGVGPEDEVLLPAYHCITMVQPVIECGARPSFYHLNSDLTINLTDAASRVGARTRALVVTHYFGFPTPLSELAEWCRYEGIILIEDCAHAMLWRGRLVDGPGCTGDYAITSTRKFLPTLDGGAFCANPAKKIDVSVERISWSSQIRAICYPFDAALYYGRCRKAQSGYWWLNNQLQKRKNHNQTGKHGCARTGPRMSEKKDRSRKMSWMSKFYLRIAKFERIGDQRRANYRSIVKKIEGSDGIVPLRGGLSDNDVPYMLPALLSRPERQFPALKMAGVPMFRWEEMVRTDCPVSRDYRLRLIHIPCHQSLRRDELEWIGRTIAETCD